MALFDNLHARILREQVAREVLLAALHAASSGLVRALSTYGQSIPDPIREKLHAIEREIGLTESLVRKEIPRV